MKKLLLLFITLLVFNKSKAQVVFCPPGAEWHYTFMSMPPTVNNEKIKYTHDSVIGTDSFKVLKHYMFFSESSSGSDGPTLIKQNGDTVFMRNARTQHIWQILYNFNTTAGQSWHCNILTDISNTTIATFTTTVDSVGITTVNGHNLKQLYVHYRSHLAPYADTSQVIITERFGCSRFLFNYTNKYATDWAFSSDFLCYQDNSFGLKQFTSKPCDFANLAGTINLSSEKNEIKLFPNPTSNFLNLTFENKNEDGNYEIRLINILGNEILPQQKIKSTNENFVLDLSSVEQGVYFAQVFEKGKLIITEKIIKE